MASKPDIIVIGAGVVGLQTALSLLKAGYGITIVAHLWPGDDEELNYASGGGGGGAWYWRPTTSTTSTNTDTDTTAESVRLRGFEAATYRCWEHLLTTTNEKEDREGEEKEGEDEDEDKEDEDEDEETGLSFTPARLLLPSLNSNPSSSTTTAEPWFSETVRDFHSTPASVEFTTVSVAPAVYMDYLLGRVGAAGARTHTVELESVANAWELPGCGDAAAAVVCAGGGARALVPDATIDPERVVTVKVRATVDSANGSVLYGSDGAYVVSAEEGGVAILGTGSGYEEVDEAVLGERIMRRCRELAPELLRTDGGFDAAAVVDGGMQVNHWPRRRGGLRLETEWVHVDGERKLVCHNYGHGGAGYQLSVGTAQEAVRLIEEALHGNNYSTFN